MSDDKKAARLDDDLVRLGVFDSPMIERAISFRAVEVDRENLEVELSFSSEAPVRRYFWETDEVGDEILDHEPGSVRLDRLNEAGPLLKFHSREHWLGKVLKAWIDGADRKGRARVKFHQSERDEFEDVATGTKDSVSVGYAVHKLVLESRSEEGGPVYRATDWEPIEISFEPTPADLTVGPGRALTRDDSEPKFRTEILARSALMPAAEDEPEETNRRSATMPDTKKLDPTVEADELERIRADATNDARDSELSRMNKITSLADKFADKVPAVGEAARVAIANGLTERQFEAMIAPILKATPTERFVESAEDSNDTGLSRKEIGQFRLTRLFLAQAFGDKEPKLREAAAFEIDACAAAAEASTSVRGGINGLIVPPEVLRAPQVGNANRGAAIVSGRQTRDMTAGGATTGADFIQTDVLGGSLIDFLRDLSVLIPRATLLRGLTGNVAIPRVTAGVAAVWAAEGQAPAEATPTLDQMVLSPLTLTAHVDVTRRLLIQASLDVEAWLRREFGAAFAVGLDNAGITDDGGSANRPEGILGQAGTFDASLLTPFFPTWPKTVAFETGVATGAALMGDLAYLTNPAVAGQMKVTSKDTGSGRYIMEEKQVDGYDVLVTNQCPADSMIFGNMKDAVFGLWEEMAFTVDPYTQANAGVIRLTGQMEADFNVRHPESFAVAGDILQP